MENSTQTKLSFHGIDILKVDFNVQRIYDFEEKINLQVDAKLNEDENDKTRFQILMDLNLKVETFFEMNIVALGSFELNADINEDLRKNFINVNAPAIMFPYLRSFVSTLTSNCGGSIPALIIPPQFFSGELQRVPKNEESQNN